jgi:hypothetical protein
LATFYKKPNNWSVHLLHQPNKQYTAGGSEGLIDGIYGDKNWRKGSWQGYQSVNMEAVIDMMEVNEISYLSSSYLQDSRSWILFPRQVSYYVSQDGKQYSLAGTQSHTVSSLLDTVMIQPFSVHLTKPVKARYVKVVADTFGKLPAGHQGYGDDAFIFIDEIEVK